MQQTSESKSGSGTACPLSYHNSGNFALLKYFYSIHENVSHGIYLITNNNVLYNLRIYKQYGHTNS